MNKQELIERVAANGWRLLTCDQLNMYQGDDVWN